jgi:hypothetical protein
MTQPHNGKPGPFVFTRWFASIDACKFWIGEFNRKGIPAGIVRAPGIKFKTSGMERNDKYAVWRTGVDAVEYGKKPSITTDMRVEISVNGFAGQFEKLQKEVADARLAADERKT